MKTRILTLALIPLFGILSCVDPDAHLAQQNKEIITKAFEVVGTGDFDTMDNYISANYVRHSQATPDLNIRSLSEFKEFIRQDRLVIPDQQLEVKKLIAEGDLVAFWAIYKGTQTGQMGPFPPSNKYVELDFSGYHRLENGKIAETWVIWDNISFLTQLGHFPPATDQPEDE
jgi:predicted ester cyclase